MRVSFYDMSQINAPYLEAFSEKLHSIMTSGIILNGPNVNEFEKNFAKINGGSHCVGLASGLDALSISLISVGIGPGDEVIVPDFTFVATWLAVLNIGAIPIPVDVNRHGLIDLELAKKKINKKTKAIIPVNLYGQTVDQNQLIEIVRNYGIYIIEDCAQSHGMQELIKCEETKKWLRAYSFYPSKIIGALGDAGAIVTNDNEIASLIKKIGNYGSVKKYEHEVLGINSRMEELHASLINLKLQNLENEIVLRKKVASRYISELENPEIRIITGKLESTFHLFVIASEHREKLIAHLSLNQIESSIHYPYIVSEIPAIKNKLSSSRRFNHYNAQDLARTVVSIPIWPKMPDEYISHIISCLNSFKINYK